MATRKRTMVKSVGSAGLERIELKQLTERIGRLYATLNETAEVEAAPIAGSFVPPVDVCETGDQVCLRIELPGVKANEIKIGLNSDKIRICGEKKPRQSPARSSRPLTSAKPATKFVFASNFPE